MKTAIYVDISGSMARTFLFDTKVYSTHIGGGTYIEAVFVHARANNITNIILITDGKYVGEIPADLTVTQIIV